MGDKEIVDLYLLRKEEAISFTRDKYGHRLRRIALGVFHDNQAAEECENDTYLDAWMRIPPNKPYGYLFSFLSCTLRHIALDFCRHRSALKRSGHVLELTDELMQCIPGGDDPEEIVDRRVLGQKINEYLQILSPDKRNIFLRRYWYMDGIREIAVGYGISESKVKTTLFRCRNELRDFLEKEGYTV